MSRSTTLVLKILKKVQAGSSSSSYGIHVAKLAGLPEKVVQNARDLLNDMPKGQIESSGRPTDGHSPETRRTEVSRQITGEGSQPTLFSAEQLIIDELRNLNVERLTPLNALNLLAKWLEDLQK